MYYTQEFIFNFVASACSQVKLTAISIIQKFISYSMKKKKKKLILINTLINKIFITFIKYKIGNKFK